MFKTLGTDICERLRELEVKVYENEAMSLHTTFKAGGNAALYAEAEGEGQLSMILRLINERKLPYFILGNGSNVLVRDSGFDGIIIRLSESFGGCHYTKELREDEQGEIVKAGAAMSLAALAKRVSAEGLAGMETLAGIPGTVGGAVAMNAGAYGGEIKDIIAYARVMDKMGAVKILGREELKLGYRQSVLLEEGLIALEAAFALKKGDTKEINEKLKECQRARMEKQPLEYPSAGSTFKRPEGYFAGKLIMDAGLRGYRSGGAMVSEKHCGFVINAENASAEDILQVIGHVIRTVQAKFKVTLEPEVKILG